MMGREDSSEVGIFLSFSWAFFAVVRASSSCSDGLCLGAEEMGMTLSQLETPDRETRTRSGATLSGGGKKIG